MTFGYLFCFYFLFIVLGTVEKDSYDNDTGLWHFVLPCPFPKGFFPRQISDRVEITITFEKKITNIFNSFKG